MTDNPILNKALEITNQFRPYVEGRYTQDRLGVETIDEDSVEINARKCAMIDVQNRLNDFLLLQTGNVDAAYLDKIKELQEIISVLKNME